MSHLQSLQHVTHPHAKKSEQAGLKESTISDTFRTLLVQKPIKELVPNYEDIVIARTTDSVGDVFRRLITYKIISVPVLNPHRNEYIGFIDMLDILYYIVDVLQIQPSQQDPEVLQTLLSKSNCVQLIDRSRLDPWVIVDAEAPIQMAINTFCMQRCHRAAVSRRGGVLSSILTQSALVRWIASFDLNTIGSFAERTLDEIGVGSSPVVSINSNELAINAFLKIRNCRVSGVAVLDPDSGRLVGNISASDLKEIGWTADMFSKLYMKSGDFVKHCEKAREARHRLPGVVWVRPDFLLYQSLKLFQQHNIHRIYVLDDKMLPQRCITLSDVLELFATQKFTGPQTA